VKYSKPACGNPPLIKYNNLKDIIKAANRIERLIKIANNNWNIVDAFPNLTVDFFKSTSINVINYERFLKLVETGKMITEERGKELYQIHKADRKHERDEYLKNIYNNAKNY